MPLTSRRLELFLAVVDHGTVTAAASERFVSQPALSQTLRELERELGTPVFRRAGRRLRLTAAGEALVEPARQVLRDLENARAAVAAVAGIEAGTLDVGSLATLAVEPLAPLVGRFRRTHPGVVVRVTAPDDLGDLLRRVRAGTVEVAISEMPSNERDLVVHRLAGQDLVWAVPVDRLRAPMRAFEFVATPVGTSMRSHLVDACAREGVEPAIAVETELREALVPLVAAGAGAALVPRPLAEPARAAGTIAVRQPRPRAHRALAIIHRAGPLAPAAQAFIELAGNPS